MNFLDWMLARVWESSVSGTILIGLGLLVLVCVGKRLPVWSRYGIWLLVLVRLLMPIAPPAGFSVLNLGKTGESPLISIAGDLPDLQPAIQPTPEATPNLRLVPMLWVVGVFGCLAVAVIRHGRLARWVRRQNRCQDARILALLDRARAAFGVRAEIHVICNDRFEVPAVFGAWRPRVLLPAQWAATASDEELFLVFLHELAHVKCRDGLLHWLCLAARSLHWFNPAAWYALWRLRKEREVFCDALVLARVRPEERAIYGNLLIKLAAQISGAAQPASLVPILQPKPEIHRRIDMIAKYKPTPWLWSLGAALVVAALAGLTFTRAADKKAPEPTAAPAGKREPAGVLQALEDETERQQARVHAMKEKVEDLRVRLQVIEPVDLNRSSGQAEAVRQLQARRIEAGAELERLMALQDYLEKLNRAALRRSISTAAPDAQFSELASNLDRAEQKLAELIESHAPDHPDVKRVTRVMAQINKQMDDRMDGILQGLKARMVAEKAHVDALQKALEEARKERLGELERNRPFHELLQELRHHEEILQRLRLRAAEKRMDLLEAPAPR